MGLFKFSGKGFLLQNPEVCLSVAKTRVSKMEQKKRMSVISTPKVLNSINNTVDKLSRASEFLHPLLRMTI